jgi:hypothetical protein
VTRKRCRQPDTGGLQKLRMLGQLVEENGDGVESSRLRGAIAAAAPGILAPPRRASSMLKDRQARVREDMKRVPTGSALSFPIGKN